MDRSLTGFLLAPSLMRGLLLFLTFGACAGVGTTAYAQDATAGRVRITVVDQTGAPIQGAAVTVAQGATEQALVAGEAVGDYTAGGLSAGEYALTVRVEGFAPAEREIRVRAGRLTTERVVVSVSINERVDVVALPLVGRSGLNGLTLTGKELALLPTNEIEMLYRLLELAGSRGRPGDVAIYVDGFRDFRRLPPKGAIEVIQINAEPYSAEFSEPGTRRIEIITKPGSDGTFGEVKADFNDESMNATDPLASGKPSLQRKIASGYFSAPIIRQRWGFVAYAGMWEQTENAAINATLLDDKLERVSFRETLAAPMRITNYTFNTGFAVGPRLRLKVEYARDEVYARNQGLKGGLSLPERALSVDNRTDAGRLNALAVLGESSVFDLRAQFKEEDAATRAVSDKPSIIVPDAFLSGANQAALRDDKTTTLYQLDTKLTLGLGTHMLGLGLQSAQRRLRHHTEPEFGGSYTFGSDVARDLDGNPLVDASGAEITISPLENYRRVLLKLPGYTPTQFSMTVGDPFSQVEQTELAAFIQNDWQVRPNLTLSVGVRGEWQTHLDGVRVAPRLGIAWQPTATFGIIRAGSGLFHDRFDPDLTLDTLRLNGERQKRFIVDHPTFFPIIPPRTIDPPSALQTIMRASDSLKAAELFIVNAGYEREFGKSLMASIGYTLEQGSRLARLVDVNAPISPGIRPNRTFGPIEEFQSVGRSERQELQLGLRVSFNEGSRLLANYTLSSTNSDVDTERTLPADSRALNFEYGPTALDERHRVFVSGTIMFPRFWLLVPSFSFASARPFNITTGLDNNFDQHLTDRPSFATPGEPGAIQTPFGLFDPTPEPGDRIIPRNFGRGARSMKFDLSLSKVLILDDPNAARRTLTLSLNGENILNTATFRDYNTVVLSPLFARPNTAEPGRRISLATTFNF